MAVYPNNYCLGFTNWMLYTSWQPLTPTRLNLITTVYNAALNGTSVTDTEYNNFIQLTSWRQPYYDAYLANNTPYSAVPILGCDFWLSSAYLTKNISNSFGIVAFNNSISRINDVNNGAIYGINALPARNPFLCIDSSQSLNKALFSFNTSANQNFQLQSFGSITQNAAGYSLFIVANVGSIGSNQWAVYCSAGASSNKSRIGLMANSSGNWTLQAVRLDADAQATLSSTAANNTMQIVCVTMDWLTGAGKIYINGVNTATNNALTSAGNTSNTACSAVSIGSINQTSNWTGNISDCLGFNSALSPADVLTVTEWLNSMRSIY